MNKILTQFFCMIRNQLRKDRVVDQLTEFEEFDPFTREKNGKSA